MRRWSAATVGSPTPRPTSASNRLAHVLAARGVGPGDHVALYLYNGTEYLEGMLAAFKLRAVPINVNYRYVEDELRYLFDDADAKAVVFHREFAPKLAAIRDRAARRCSTFVAVDDGTRRRPRRRLGASTTRPRSRPRRRRATSPPRSADDLYILYTGGTTGMPKGVMWRHEDIFFGALGGGGVGGPRSRRPRRSPSGARRAAPAASRRARSCTAPRTGWRSRRSSAAGPWSSRPSAASTRSSIWELVAREQVNFLVIVGDAFGRPLVDALDEPRRRRVDLSVLGVILSGGAILSPTVKRELVERLPSTIVIDGYRLVGDRRPGPVGHRRRTATIPIAAALPRQRRDHRARRRPAARRPSASSASSPAAATSRSATTRTPRRPRRRSPWSTACAGRSPATTPRIEDDGTITLLGRGSVSINTGGEKVYPEEVEARAQGAPDVFDAVVVGVPDERWGERVVAVVQSRDGRARSTLDELDEHVRAHVAGLQGAARRRRRRRRSCARRRASPTTAGRKETAIAIAPHARASRTGP